MSIVRSIDDIDKNALTLLQAAHGKSDERVDAAELIAHGRVFYPLQFEGYLAFVPSRFIGYRNNNISIHNQEKAKRRRDGKETNSAIARVLGKHAPDAELEQRFSEYCKFLGVEPTKHVHKFWRIAFAKAVKSDPASAINDISDDLVDNDDPEYKIRMRGSYVRVEKVRRKVLERANGLCEYEGCVPFKNRRDTPYLEAHHVIKLSQEGRDKESNVIALCANHHREAHFGQRWEALQDEFLTIISKKMSH